MTRKNFDKKIRDGPARGPLSPFPIAVPRFRAKIHSAVSQNDKNIPTLHTENRVIGCPPPCPSPPPTLSPSVFSSCISYDVRYCFKMDD